MDQGAPIRLKESGVPAERRLARAFNRAAGTFAVAEAQATRDRLTGIPNRESLLRTLGGEVERANRHSKPLSVAFMDIDRFKSINDSHGHRIGDAVLQQVAGLITRSIRASDIFGRYGGEEFMLILPETTPEDAFILVEELREMVMRRPLSVASGVLVDATISIGVAGGHSSELQVDRLVDAADAAMYVAKSEGGTAASCSAASPTSRSFAPRGDHPERRDAAAAIGRWASASAAQALASVLAPQPHHRGRPSDMIAALSIGVGLHMGLSRVEMERIRIAALLHDLGKLALPGEILDKPSSLTDIEWQVVGEHPRIGQVILEQATSMRDAVPIVLHHHERFDGTGYPHGLRGEEIPLGARIVAVADAYHAMVHERPYKSALTHAQALPSFGAMLSTQFDPTVVEVFLAIFGDEVPSDGQEEIHRLHDHAEGGVEAMDPRPRRCSRPRSRHLAELQPEVRASRATGPAARRRPTRRRVRPRTRPSRSPLRPVEQRPSRPRVPATGPGQAVNLPPAGSRPDRPITPASEPMRPAGDRPRSRSMRSLPSPNRSRPPRTGS